MPATVDPSKPILLTPNTPDVDTLLRAIVHLHAHCILHDGTLATYLPPLSLSKMLAYWQSLLDQVSLGTRHIILQLMPVSSRTANVADPVFAGDSDSSESSPAPTLNIAGSSYEVAGVVSLCKPESETGPFRGEVEKLFTSPNHRRKGVARCVMRELERCAREDGRWSLLLDTTVGTDAEGVYPRLGYVRMGEVKAYGISPVDGREVDEVWFLKDLRRTTEL